MNQSSADYERRNKDKRRERDRVRASHTDGVRRGFDLGTKKSLWDKQSGKCACCFEAITSPNDGEVDHIKPLARGGTDTPDNRLLAHAKCNREKHNKSLVEHWEWRVRVGLDSENLGRKYGFDRYRKPN